MSLLLFLVVEIMFCQTSTIESDFIFAHVTEMKLIT